MDLGTSPDILISFEANFASKLSFKESGVAKEDNEVSETILYLVWSPEHEEAERGEIGLSDSVDDNVDEIIVFDSVGCLLLGGVLVEESKMDSIVRRWSGFIFSLEIMFHPQANRMILC